MDADGNYFRSAFTCMGSLHAFVIYRLYIVVMWTDDVVVPASVIPKKVRVTTIAP